MRTPNLILLLGGLAAVAALLVAAGILFFDEKDLAGSSEKDGRIHAAAFEEDALTIERSARSLAESLPLFREEGEPLPAREALPASFLTSFVRGTVETKSAEPLSGAVLSIGPALPEPIRDALPGGDYTAKSRSGLDGRFEIPLPAHGAFSMNVEKDGCASFFIDLVLPGDDLRIVLERGIVLTGTVRDEETGDPVVNARVMGRRHIQVFEAVTDEDGCFSLAGLPEGFLAIEVFHEEYELVRMDGVRIEEDAHNTVELEMPPGRPLGGRVLALDTRMPLSGAEVVYTIGFRGREEREEIVRLETAADEEGEFLFESVSLRGFRLVASAEGYSPARPEPHDPFEPRRGGSGTLFLDIYLKKESAVSGTVFDPDGDPVGGASVTLLASERSGGTIPRTVTDSKGFFSIAGLEGNVPFVLAASSSGFGPARSDGFMAAEGEAIEDVVIRFQRPSEIKGIVLGPDKQPFQGARITIDGMKGFLVRFGDTFPLALSDEQGRFGFPGLVEGEYKIAAGRDNFRSPELQVFLQEGEEYEAILQLEDGLILQGRVVDLAGDPLDDVLVSAVESTREHDRGAVSAVKKNRSTSDGKSSRRGGSGRRASKERASERIKRSLRDSEKRRAPGEFDLVRRHGLSRWRGNARSDEEGRFRLSGLNRDDVLLLTFRRFGYGLEVMADVSPSGGEVTAVMAPEVVLQGRVIDFASSAPVERFRVEWVAVTGDSRSTDDILKDKGALRGKTGSRTFHSPDGTFLIERMEPGEIIMRVSGKGYRTCEARRIVIPSRYPPPYQTFNLEKGGAIHGRLTAANGSPVSNVSVYLKKVVKKRLDENGFGEKGLGEKKKKRGKKKKPRLPVRQSDKRGKFFFLDLDAGVYRLCVGDPNEPVNKPADIKLSRGRNASKTIILRDLGGVEVRVRSKSGLSCRAVVELAGGPGKSRLRGMTGNLGTATFRNVLPGEYRLNVRAKGFRPSSRKVTVKKKTKAKEKVTLKPK